MNKVLDNQIAEEVVPGQPVETEAPLDDNDENGVDNSMDKSETSTKHGKRDKLLILIPILVCTALLLFSFIAAFIYYKPFVTYDTCHLSQPINI